MTARRFVDTGVLLYSISRDRDEAPKQERAAALLQADDLALSIQVLQEFYVQATDARRADALPHDLAAGLVRAWMRFPVQEMTPRLHELALEIEAEHGLAYWDATVIAAAQSLGCADIHSAELRLGQRVGGVTVVNPFRCAAMLFGPLTKPRQTVMEIMPASSVRRRSMTSGGVTAEVVRALGRDQVEVSFQAPLHLLVLFEQGARRKLAFAPAEHAYCERHELRRAVCFYFEPARPPGLSEALVPRLSFEDAALSDTALKVARLIESTSCDIAAYFEALCAVLAHELVRAGGEEQVKGGLAPWQQRAVVAYMEEHLGEPVKLATLAALVRLSPHYFCRAFKQSFSVPPHRYHTALRIEQAKALLARPSSSVTEVGLSMGFQETSSFTALFHRTTGLTPTAYRRSLL